MVFGFFMVSWTARKACTINGSPRQTIPHIEAANRIGGVMVNVLASSVVVRGFEPRSDQTKGYEICLCWFSSKHAALGRKRKDWLARNHDNVT